LDMGRVIPVRAPIRYGRKSRHGTYTMVFAPGSPMGQAKVVACEEHATSVADIFSQAKALWLAERPPDARPLPGQLYSARWGCVAILPRPNGGIPSNLIDEWAQQAAQECSGPSKTRNYDPAAYNVRGRAATAIDPRAGRFLQRDPLMGAGTAAGANRRDNARPLAARNTLDPSSAV